MSSSAQRDPVKTARRAGMSVVVALIVWTILAVTLGVVRGIREDARGAAETAPAAQHEAAP